MSGVLKDFVSYFGATELFLTNNFRSASTIVNLANNTVVRKEEKMVCTKEDKGSITYAEFDTEDAEVSWIIQQLRSMDNANRGVTTRGLWEIKR